MQTLFVYHYLHNQSREPDYTLKLLSTWMLMQDKAFALYFSAKKKFLRSNSRIGKHKTTKPLVFKENRENKQLTKRMNY